MKRILLVLVAFLSLVFLTLLPAYPPSSLIAVLASYRVSEEHHQEDVEESLQYIHRCHHRLLYCQR